MSENENHLWEGADEPKSIPCVTVRSPAGKVTLSTVQEPSVWLFTGTVVSGPVYAVLSMAPNSKVPGDFVLKLQAMTGMARLFWTDSIKVGC